MKLEKMFFISLQKLFSFSRKPKFKILDIKISQPHQICLSVKQEIHFTE